MTPTRSTRAALAAALLWLGASACTHAEPTTGPQPTGTVTAAVQVRGEVGAARTAGYRELGNRALVQVEALWGPGSVHRPVRIELPADAAAFAEATGHPAGQEQVPATVVGSGPQTVVVVHPDAWDRLTPQGRQAVVTHEVTHLATQGDGPVPAWLGEGLAEYTAHRASSTPVEVVAGSALEPARRGEVPHRWPEPGQGAAEERWSRYALSWLACVYIAEEHSEEELLELYTTVAAGTPLPQALPAVLGQDEATVLRGWGAWLTELGLAPPSG